jgi:gliding motility-associated-like protein
MITKKPLLFFTVLFILRLDGTAQVPPVPQVPILLNEYSASNVTGPTDNFGQHSDWVEILNNHSEAISFGDYYLSNDRNNLYKWKFPSSFKLNPGQLKVVWLSGRNVSSGDNFHANFTLEQCREEWLILSTSAGKVRDSVYVQRTQKDHTRGRVITSDIGINNWRLYTQHSILQHNPPANNYIDYAPTPQIVITDQGIPPGKENIGGFFPGMQLGYIRLQGQKYDTAVHKCFNVFFTMSDAQGLSADYPIESYPELAPSVQYYDTVTPFIIDRTMVVRVIAVPNKTATACGNYLPSFCETNTYFIDQKDLNFSPDFGVVSLAFDKADTSWFTAQGSHPPSTRETTIHVEYYDKLKHMNEGYGLVNRPPHEEWRTKQRGFYIDIDDKRGFGCNFQGNIFNVSVLGTTNRTVFPTLHLKGGDIESHSPIIGSDESFGTGVRDVLMQSLAAKNKLNVNPMHIKPVVAYMNGKYWGVFNFYEVYDKYYEHFYKGQFLDSLDLHFVDNNTENSVTYFDGSVSSTTSSETWRSLYDQIMNGQMNSKVQYDAVMAKLDKASFIDYMILNSYSMNSDLWRNNVAFGRGLNKSAPGGKWHYFLWNMPSIFNYTALSNPGTSPFSSPGISPCFLHSGLATPIGQGAYTGHGNIFRKLMNTVDNDGLAAGRFQLEYKNRYYDLMNGPLKCENIIKHFESIYKLYLEEMKFHEDLGNDGAFASEIDRWDTLMLQLKNTIGQRCYINELYFRSSGCYGAAGPYPLTVDVYPEGAGTVKLNTTHLDSYKWSGKYYQTTLSFKAIPTSTNYVFHHWEFSNHTPLDPLSMDSIGVAFTSPGDDVVAVFTDKTNELAYEGEGANIPTGFTPNGDGLNDDFKPLGSGEFAMDYEMTIWNRWGQEVFRSVDPHVGWDGYFKGQAAITGVYAYIIKYRNVYGESKLVKGNVTLTR